MHWSRSQCLVLQGAVPTWLPPEVILFSLAARNSQWVYQDSVKYHSVVHLSNFIWFFIWLLNIHIKICLQVVDGSLQLFWGEETSAYRLQEKRKTDKRQTYLCYSWHSKYPLCWFLTSTNTFEKQIHYFLLQVYRDYKGDRHPVQVN